MPTHQQNLAFVREKVIAACPEIMELKYGCLLDLYCGESAGLATIVGDVGQCKKHKKTKDACYEQDNGCEVQDRIYATAYADEDGAFEHSIDPKELKPYQIIGRTIRLSDVLRAMGDRRVGISTSGMFIGAEIGRGFVAEGVVWNLSQDDLSLQSEPLVAFLAEVLKSV